MRGGAGKTAAGVGSGSGSSSSCSATGAEIAYGSAAGLMVSPVPRSTFGATLRYFF